MAAVIAGVLVLVGAGVAVVTLSGSSSGDPQVAVPSAGEQPGLADEEPVDSDFDDAPSASDDPTTDEDGARLPERTVSVGEAVVDDDITFKVDSFEVVGSVPTGEFSDGPIVPRDGAKLVQAVVTWKNNTGVPVDMFCGGGGARLVDQEGNNYDLVEDLIDIVGNDICGDDVGPGFRRTDTLVFEIPDNQMTEAVALWNGDAEDDSFGETFVAVVK